MTPTTKAAKRIEMERAMEIHRKTKLVSSSVRRLFMKGGGLTRSSGTTGNCMVYGTRAYVRTWTQDPRVTAVNTGVDNDLLRLYL